MSFIDSHTHLSELTFKNLEWMYLTGIREIVSPVQLVAARTVSSHTIRDMWDHQFGIQVPRAQGNLIKVYSMIGISMVSLPENDPQELYEALPEYLQKPQVVAIGEIGFEPASKSSADLGFQEEIMRKQMRIAKELAIPVNFHVPHPPDKKKVFTEKTLQICLEMGLDFNKVIIDHCSDANIEMVLESGAAAAVSIQPWRGMTPEIAAELVMKYPERNIMLNSDCGTGDSDPYAVAKAAFALKKKGAPDELVNKVCRENCRNTYKLTEAR